MRKFINKTGVISKALAMTVFIILAATSFAANKYSVASGNWNATSTWSLSSGGAPGAPVPVAGDVVIIEGGKTVTVSVALNINVTITISAGSKLLCNASLGIKNSANPAVTVNGTLDVTVNNGINKNGAGNDPWITVSNGGLARFGLAGKTGIKKWNLNAGSTVELYGAGNQDFIDIGNPSTFSNVILSGTLVKKMKQNTIVNGVLSIQNAATLNLNGKTLTYGGSATLEYKNANTRNIGPEWTVTPFVATGGIIINSSGSIITVNAARAIGNGSKINLVQGTLAAGTNLSMNSTSAIYRSGGSITGTLQGAGAYDVYYTGTSKTTGPELGGSGLRNVDVSLSSLQTLTLDANRAPDGNLSVTTGILDVSTFLLNRSAAGGTLTISNAATLKIGGTNTLPSSYSTHSIGSLTTIEYAGSGQSIADLNSAQTYGNLTLSGSGTKTFGTTVKTISAQLSISTGVVAHLGTGLTHPAGNLVLGGIGKNAGSWGATISPAVNKDDVFFTSNTGIINAANNGCTPPNNDILGDASVCPSSTGNSYTTTGGDNYTFVWTISGAGTIVGSSTSQSVTVTANPDCGSNFTLYLAVTDQTTTCNAYNAKVVNVVDTDDPSWTLAPSNTTVECDGSGNTTELNNWLTSFYGSDGCPGGTNVTNNFVGEQDPEDLEAPPTSWVADCGSSKHATVTFYLTDACGNAISASATFTIRDLTAPVISSLPAATTISCPASPSFAVPTASDACGSSFTLSSSDASTAGACAGAYTKTRTWTAIDACGNSSTAAQTITVIDNTAPTIGSAGANTTISCPASPSFTAPTATDACDASPSIVLVSDNSTGGTCTGTYTRTKVWKAVDACGNESGTVSQTITVIDNTAPTIGSAGANTTISCPASPSFTAPTATDACDASPSIVLVSDNSTGGTCTGTYTRTKVWKAVDACGNESGTVSQTITVIDNTAPTIGSAGANTTISCPASPSFTAPTATDACDASPSIVLVSDNSTGGSCTGTYTRTKVWKAVDACGNQSGTVSQTITVIDNTAPTIGSAGANTTISCPASPSFTPPSATDACDASPSIVLVSDNSTAGSCTGAYTRTRTWKAVDACGNQSGTVSQTITVIDNTAPTIGSAGANTTISCPASPIFTPPSATDACDASPSIVLVSDNSTGGTCTGTYTRTKVWKAVDACGNQSGTVSQTITVIDNTAPTIGSAGANTTISCPASPIFTPPSATDACDASPSIELVSDNSTAGSCTGTYTRTKVWKAVDACGNESGTVSQTITVIDNTAPTIGSAGANTTISCPASPSFTAPTATDACDASPSIELVSDNSTAGSCAGTYTRTMVWKAVDACGNQSGTVSQTITVIDNTAPTIGSAGANTTLSCPASSPTFTAPTATDACDASPSIVLVSDNSTAGGCAGTYTRTMVWKAVDACGNQSGTVSQTITVIDNTAPTIGSAGANTTISCPASPSFTPPSATDACDASPSIVLVSDNSTAGSCTGAYTRTRTWKAVDACGNQSGTVSQTITVIDNVAPTLTGTAYPGTTSTNACLADAATAAAFNATNAKQGYTDNCGGAVTATLTGTSATGTNASWTVTYTFKVEDACGNALTGLTYSNTGGSTSAGPGSGYTILAQDEVHVHKNIVNGNVGVWTAGKEDAKIHEKSTVNGFVRAPVIDLTGGSVITGAQILSTAPAPATAFRYNTTAPPASDITVPANYVGVYLLNGTNFRKITIGINSTAKFSSSGDIKIKELIMNDADPGKTTNLQFSGNSELLIKTKLDIGIRCNVNLVGSYSVKMYVEETDVHVRESSKVTASIDVRFKSLIPDASIELNHTIMTGNYIAKRVDSHPYVDWFGLGGGCAAPSVVNEELITIQNKNVIVSEDGNKFSASVFPNPASSEFNIRVTSTVDDPIKIRIVDISGRVLLTQQTTNNKIVSMGRTLSSGVYFAEVLQGKNKKILKLVKINN